MSYYADDNGWAYYFDEQNQAVYVTTDAGEYVQYADLVQEEGAASGSRSDGERSTGSGGSRGSKDSKGSKGSKASKGSSGSAWSKKSSGSGATDSGQSSNTPAMTGWRCNYCETVNPTDHFMIPFMEPIGYDDSDPPQPIFEEYPYVPCGGCAGQCTPWCHPIEDP